MLVAFTPTVDTIYPGGLEIATAVDVPVLGKLFCGVSRPSFFRGVCTVVNILFNLVQEEGLCLGGSAGINIAGAIAMAKELGPGHTIVTVLCDYGNRYQSKLYNPEFLRSKDLPVPSWMETV